MSWRHNMLRPLHKQVVAVAKKSALEQQLEQLDQLKKRGALTDAEYESRRQAIIVSAPITAQVQPKSGAGGIFKFGFFGCLGVIGAFVALIVVIAIIAAAGSSGSDDGDTPAQPGETGTNKGDVHVAFAANSSGEIAPDGNKEKRTKVTILQSSDIASNNQFLKPNAGMKWYGIEVVVENTGTKEVSSLDWKLRDSKDGEHDREIVVGGVGKDLDGVFNLTPGGKTQGWIYFEIPVDATPKWLRADPNVFLKNDLYFDVK